MPLLRRAYALWRELEAATGRRVLHVTGSLDVGAEDDDLFNGALLSAREHDLAHEVLTGAQVNERFPAYRLPARLYRAVWQPEGGFIASERAIVAHVLAAQAEGADIRARERVLDWSADAGGVRVRTERGSYEAERLVLTAGAWMARPRSGAGPPRAARAAGAGVAPAPRAGAVRAGAVPGVQHVGPADGRLVRGCRCSTSPASSSAATIIAARRGRPRRCAARWDAEDEALLRGVRVPLLPRGRRPRRWPCAPACSPTTPRRALHHRPPSRARAGGDRVALLRPRLQVLQRRRRDPRRPGVRPAPPRHRVPATGPLQPVSPRPGAGENGGDRAQAPDSVERQRDPA